MQVGAGQMGHVGVIEAFAARVQRAAAFMTPQVAVEIGTDVIKLVEQRDELFVEILIEKARQTERHQVEDFASVDEIALQLIETVALPPRQSAVTEAHGSDPRLQAVPPAAARLGHAEKQA